ncbi:MAG: hypothetical protein IJE78_05170 [Bacteroidaceae bacterium]|nr:hypothetical protein [Bacteroidaceae bacterium]
MKVPQYIQDKVLRLERLTRQSNMLLNDIITWMEAHGGDEMDDEFRRNVKDNCSYTFALDLHEFKEYMKDK